MAQVPAAEFKVLPRTIEGLWLDMAPEDFLKRLRDFAASQIAPHADIIDKNDLYPREIIKTLAQQGYTSFTLPPPYGSGTSHRLNAAFFEEISYASAAVGISLITIFQAQTLIVHFGSDSLKEVVLPEFGKGLLTSYALTEANHGSDIRKLDTKARAVGTSWVLNGRKSFITSGSGAEAFIILAETDNGVSTFFVRRDTPGITSFEGPNAATFGLRNGPHVDIILEEVRVPADHLIGTEGKGVRQAVTTLDFSRTMAAAISIGIARAAFDAALRFAAKRVAFDRKVADFQGIQWYFADLLSSIDAARLLVYEAAAALDDHRDIARLSSQAKLLASEVATETASKAVQICGAYGVMEIAPFGRFLRDAKAYEIAGGSVEILKNTIGKRLRSIFDENGKEILQ